MRTIATPSKGDHMWMFGKEEEIRDFPFHTSRPEGMLKIPGLFVIHQTKIYRVSLVSHWSLVIWSLTIDYCSLVIVFSISGPFQLRFSRRQDLIEPSHL